MNTEYHKIETPYKRDINGTKKLIRGAFRNPCVEFLKNCPWIWKEKVDGTNIRVVWDGHNVTIGGRTDNAKLPQDLLKRLEDLFKTSEAEELFEQLFGEKEAVIYGEGYGAGIQSVGKEYLDHKDFIVFDVRINGFYLDIPNGKEIAKAFGVRYVPVMLMGTIDDAVDFVKTRPLSYVAKNRLVAEGIVGSPEVCLKDSSNNRIIVKVKTEDF